MTRQERMEEIRSNPQWWKEDPDWVKALGKDERLDLMGYEVTIFACDEGLVVSSDYLSELLAPGPFDMIEELVEEAIRLA